MKRESKLHEELKRLYADQMGGETEVSVAGFSADVIKDRQVVEIQLGKLLALKPKIRALLGQGYSVKVVLPLQVALTAPVRKTFTGKTFMRTTRRRTSFLNVFDELVYWTDVFPAERLSLEVLLLHEGRDWVAKTVTVWRGRFPRRRLLNKLRRDTKVVEIMDKRVFKDGCDLLNLLPDNLPDLFTNRDLAKLAGISYSLAARVTYTLKALQALEKRGRRDRSTLYSASSNKAY